MSKQPPPESEQEVYTAARNSITRIIESGADYVPIILPIKWNDGEIDEQ